MFRINDLKTSFVKEVKVLLSKVEVNSFACPHLDSSYCPHVNVSKESISNN
jgi:hypothetical protein